MRSGDYRGFYEYQNCALTECTIKLGPIPGRSFISREMEQFILELGVGFTFVARQKRITVGEDDFYLDLQKKLHEAIVLARSRLAGGQDKSLMEYDWKGIGG